MREEEVMGTADFLPIFHDGQNTGAKGSRQALTDLLVLSLTDVLRIGSKALSRRHYPVDVNRKTFWTNGTRYDMMNGLPWQHFRGFVCIKVIGWRPPAVRAFTEAMTDWDARRDFRFLLRVAVGRMVKAGWSEVGGLEGSSRARMGAMQPALGSVLVLCNHLLPLRSFVIRKVYLTVSTKTAPPWQAILEGWGFRHQTLTLRGAGEKLHLIVFCFIRREVAYVREGWEGLSYSPGWTRGCVFINRQFL